MMQNLQRILMWVLVIAGLTVPAWGQSRQRNRDRNPFAQGTPLTWDIDESINFYVKQIGRHYNLTEQQQEYTRLLMTKRTKRFLKHYEADVRDIFAEYMTYQLTRQVPPPEIAREFADRADPLIRAMRKEVIEGNMQWRNILNEEQKNIHDKDMDQLNVLFDEIQGTMGDWKEGKVYSLGNKKAVSVPTRPMRSEDQWDRYVRSFIRRYGLDEAQQETAWSMLREMKQKAESFRAQQKDKFDQLEKRQEQLEDLYLQGDEASLEKMREMGKELYKQRQEVEKPIAGMFEDLKKQLNRIPTSDQKRRVNTHRKMLQTWAERNTTKPAADENGQTRPADEKASASQPS